MIDFRLDEPLALLAEAFGQDGDGATPVRTDAEPSVMAAVPSAPVIAASATVAAEASAAAIRAD